MFQVPARVGRLTALAALFALTGPAAQAGVVAMPQWGVAPGAAHPTAAQAARCLEIEEVTARGRGGMRFEATWSRDASCQLSPAAAGAPGPAAPVPQAATPSPAQLPAPQTPAPSPNGAGPAAPAPSATPPAPPAPAAAPQSTQAPAAAPAVVPAPAVPPAPSGSAAPPAPALQSSEGPAPAPPTAATPPAQEPVPQRSAPEAPAPGAIVISPEQPADSGPTPGITSPANELTGIGPRPIAEEQSQAPGTIPEPSSLWLLALGVAAAWRSRRR